MDQKRIVKGEKKRGGRTEQEGRGEGKERR